VPSEAGNQNERAQEEVEEPQAEFEGGDSNRQGEDGEGDPQ
jgi:hypothetical protein